MKIVYVAVARVLFVVSMFSIFPFCNVNGQIPVVIQLSTPKTGDLTATRSITLSPGFSTSGPFRAYITPALDQPLVSFPSQDQNYILTNVVRKEGVKDVSQLSGLSVSELNQSIQYFDGLGRPCQTVMVQASPGFADVLQPFAYDAYGREAVKYGSYTINSTGGSYRTDALTAGTGLAAFYTSAPAGIVNTIFPYSRTIFEPSPLNRVTEQSAPGAVWQPVAGSNAGHTVKMAYGTNNSDIASLSTSGFGVRFFRADIVTTAGHERILSTTGLYAASQLYLTISYDENWTSGKAGSMEEYKDKEGHVVLKRTFNASVTGTVTALSTYYVYDDFGNLSFVLPPGANPDAGLPGTDLLNDFCYQYRYDGWQRLIEKKIPDKGWEEVIYNQLDQVVFTRDAVQAGLASPTRSFVKYDGLGRVIMTGVVSGQTLDRSTIQSTVNAATTNWDTRDNSTGNYHGYNNVSYPSDTLNMDVEIVNYYDNYQIPGLPYDQSASFSKMTNGLLTATKVKVLGTSRTYLWTVNYYDDRGRVVKQYKQHYLSGAAVAANYDEISNTYNFANELKASTRVHHVGTASTTIAKRYDYDQVGRKLTTWESIDGAPEVALSQLAYNELGQVLNKSLHSTDGANTFLQSSAFAYNERGWLKRNTSPQFSFELKYQDGTTPQYNGNIANQLWSTPESSSNNFTYSYDKLNRLLKGTSIGRVMSEALSYDVMGNISTLSRDEGTTGTYSYTGNRLKNIAGGPLATGNYAYDANGNVTVDGRTGVTLTYNHLNLPFTATKTGLNLAYVYDAAGNKLRKISNGETRSYIDGIEYIGSTIDIIHTEEGLARKGSAGYSYEYNLTDQLGNVRYSFHQNPSTKALERIAETNYYPFGKTSAVLQGDNKYLYNGKELQDELEQYDYGARFYDPVIGRWNVVDPLVELYQESASSYVYVSNNPVRLTDPDGRYPGDPTDPPVKKLDLNQDSGDQIGIIRNATVEHKRQNPVNAFIADLAHDFLDAFGINAIDNAVYSDGKLSAGQKVFLAITILQSVPVGEGKGGGVSAYDVGSYSELKSGSLIGDGLDVHHVPQKQQAGQIIDGYNKESAPAIAIPRSEHVAIPTKKGANTGSARSQLAKDILDLRNNTNAPVVSLQQLIEFNKKMYPELTKSKK